MFCKIIVLKLGTVNFMLENLAEVKKITSSVIRYFEQENNFALVEILKGSYPSSEQIDYDNWNGGTYIYAFTYEIEIELYRKHRALLETYEKEIYDVAQLFIRAHDSEHLACVYIRPACRQYLNWSDLPQGVTKQSILQIIDRIKTLMISVSTGGPRIQDVNYQYKELYKILDKYLGVLGAQNPNPYKDLWEWYGRWSQADLSTYASRRLFIPQLYEKTVDEINKSQAEFSSEVYEPTGWDRVDRAIYEMKKRIAVADTEEKFQAIGMLGREALITAAQQVFVAELHKTEDGVVPSNTDSKRMLDAYFMYVLSGPSNERYRKFAKSAIDLANHLTHDRMAEKSDAEMCIAAVTAVINLVRILDCDG